MLRISVALIISAVLIPAHADIYKCNVGGSTVYQEAPCPGTKFERRDSPARARSADPKASSAASAASQPTPAANTDPLKARLTTYERDRHIRESQQRISDLQTAIASRNAQMNRELAALKDKKTHASNNLAGAQWEQSISSEMSAVTEKYRTLNDADLQEITSLRTQIQDAQRSQ